MATYPSLPITPSSRRVTRDGRQESLSDSGKVYIRRLQTADKYDFEIRHEALTAAQMVTLNNFYSSYANSLIDFVWPADASTYTDLRFGRNGYQTEPSNNSPTCTDVFVRLVPNT
jgi:hypothetical protein